MSRLVAFADWWACDEPGARAYARMVIWEQRGRLNKSCAELGVNWQTASRGKSRRCAWAVFLREESRLVAGALHGAPMEDPGNPGFRPVQGAGSR
jgi:hypothetical protein